MEYNKKKCNHSLFIFYFIVEIHKYLILNKMEYNIKKKCNHSLFI